MSAENINSIFTFFAFIMGVISVLLMWVYVIEAIKGIEAAKFYVFRRYVDTSYIASFLISLIIWLTTTEADKNLCDLFLTMSILWVLTILAITILSLVIDIDNTDKNNMRATLPSCFLKAFISVVILMFIA